MTPMSSDVAEIISAIEFAAQRDLRHFTHDDGKTRIALWRDGVADVVVAPPPRTAAPRTAAPQISAPISAPAADTVKAPLAGLCHLAPDPASAPFVTEGSLVSAGQTLCIIEAMKMMTAVPAPHGGTVVKIHVSNGTSLSVDDSLMDIRP